MSRSAIRWLLVVGVAMGSGCGAEDPVVGGPSAEDAVDGQGQAEVAAADGSDAPVDVKLADVAKDAAPVDAAPVDVPPGHLRRRQGV